MAGENIGKGLPDGMTLGSSITEKLAFYGVTPVVQQDNIPSVTTATNNLAAVNLIITALETYGLTATS